MKKCSLFLNAVLLFAFGVAAVALAGCGDKGGGGTGAPTPTGPPSGKAMQQMQKRSPAGSSGAAAPR